MESLIDFIHFCLRDGLFWFKLLKRNVNKFFALNNFSKMALILTQQQKIEIVSLYLEGYLTQDDIVTEINQKYFNGERRLKQSTVSKLIRKFRETGSVATKPRTGRPQVSENVKQQIMELVQNNVHSSVRGISKEINVSKSSVWNTLKQAKFHPYKMQITFRILEIDYQTRMDFCNLFLERMNAGEISSETVLWSDESLFYLNGVHNKQNYRYWCQQNPGWMSERRYKTDAKVMVWTGVIGQHIIGPYFFEDTVTQYSYLELLETFVLPELRRLGINPNNIWFMQDGAGPHFALTVRAFLNATFPNWIGRGGPFPWPPRSPDLTPLDFFLWGVIKHRIFQTEPRDLEDLIQRIEDAHNQILPETLNRVHMEFNRRIRVCLARNGRHVEPFIR